MKTKTKTKMKTKTPPRTRVTPKAKAKAATATRTFEQLLATYPDHVQTLARATRARIRDLLRELIPDLPALVECVDGSGPYIGYGFTTGYKGQVCTIILSKADLKLGIIGGASLSDPDELLEGSGKVHRFVHMKSAADLDRPGLAPLLQLAARAARAATGK